MFGFLALQAVIMNKAMSLIVVLTALPARLAAVPIDTLRSSGSGIGATPAASALVWRCPGAHRSHGRDLEPRGDSRGWLDHDHLPARGDSN